MITGDINKNYEKIKNGQINNKNLISKNNISNNNEKIVHFKNYNLIKNIKSNDVSNLLFLNLDEKIKLKAIKYNKNLQSKIGITLNNYKFYSEKYIIYEKKRKGKEYSGHDDKLIFEGEYLNEKRNGKGKEYDYNGNLIFEGEYLNGKRWNGKVFDINNTNIGH